MEDPQQLQLVYYWDFFLHSRVKDPKMNLKIFLAREFRLVRNVIVLAAGGSGGHIFPAQALAENLLKRGWDVILITDVRGVAYTSDFPKKVEKFVLKISNPSAGGIYSSCIFSYIFPLAFFCCEVHKKNKSNYGHWLWWLSHSTKHGCSAAFENTKCNSRAK